MLRATDIAALVRAAHERSRTARHEVRDGDAVFLWRRVAATLHLSRLHGPGLQEPPLRRSLSDLSLFPSRCRLCRSAVLVFCLRLLGGHSRLCACVSMLGDSAARRTRLDRFCTQLPGQYIDEQLRFMCGERLVLQAPIHRSREPQIVEPASSLMDTALCRPGRICAGGCAFVPFASTRDAVVVPGPSSLRAIARCQRKILVCLAA